MSRAGLAALYASALALLAGMCVWAGLERGIPEALAGIAADRWGLTTLVDLYAAFVTVWLWIAWRERSAVARIAWALLIAGLGSMAIAAYVLLALRRLPAGSGVGDLLQPLPQ